MAARSLCHQIIDLLARVELTGLAISQALAIQKKEVPEHLAPIICTLGRQGRKRVVSPSCCLG